MFVLQLQEVRSPMELMVTHTCQMGVILFHPLLPMECTLLLLPVILTHHLLVSFGSGTHTLLLRSDLVHCVYIICVFLPCSRVLSWSPSRWSHGIYAASSTSLSWAHGATCLRPRPSLYSSRYVVCPESRSEIQKEGEGPQKSLHSSDLLYALGIV